MRSHLQRAGTRVLAMSVIAGVLLALPARARAAEDESTSRSAWLGVSVQTLDGQLREGLDYRGGGVLVNRVAEGSPAERAGLHQGDIIVSLEGKGIQSPEELQSVVHDAHPGERVHLEVSRDGNRESLTVTLGERPDNLSRDERRRVVIRTDRDDEENPDLEHPGDIESMKELKDLKGLKGDLDHLGDLPMAGRGRLGVQLQDLNPDLGSYFSVPEGKGALIVQVEKDSPAARAGFRAGDVIVRVGDRATESADEAANAIREREGRTSITIVRRGQRQTLDVELVSRVRVQRTLREPRMSLEDVPGAGERRRHESDLHREMQELREEIRELREELRQQQKSQN